MTLVISATRLYLFAEKAYKKCHLQFASTSLVILRSPKAYIFGLFTGFEMAKQRSDSDKQKSNRQSVDITDIEESIETVQDSKEWAALSMAQKCRVLIEYGIEYLKSRSKN